MALNIRSTTRIAVTAFTMVVSSALSTAGAAQCVAPDHMNLSDALRTANLQNAKMFPISLNTDSVTGKGIVTEKESILSGEMIKDHLGLHGAVAFIVRRPG